MIYLITIIYYFSADVLSVPWLYAHVSHENRDPHFIKLFQVTYNCTFVLVYTYVCKPYSTVDFKPHKTYIIILT